MSTITDTTGWRLVALLNWQLDFDYRRIQDEIESKISPTNPDHLQAWCVDKRKDLQSILDRHADSTPEGRRRFFGIGDDSFNDLCCHIVGLGKTFYEVVCDRPQIAKEMADKRNFKENFEYSFHKN